MNAADLLRRAEDHRRWSRFVWLAVLGSLGIGGLVGLGVYIHHAGVAEGRALEQRAAFEQALKDNAEKLRLAALHRDSTKKVATAAVDRAATHRDTTRATVASVVPATDTTLALPDLPPLVLPKLAIDAYRDLLGGRRIDSLTIVQLRVDNAALETENFLLNERIGDYAQHETEHAAEVKTAARRGFWKGVKVTALTVGGIGLAAIIF